jgi:hypothetical protein
MSNTVDNRVVQMEFNNKDFEKNASKTIKTLDKLDDALKLKNGAKSFKDVEEAAAKVNFEPLKQAVEETKSKIDVLAMSANWAVKNVVDSLINMSKKLLKSVTIDPIAEGFSKYEEKTASVQTLMNSTGLSIDEVNGYLNKLMTFSDETSYSFTQMTSALSTMTSAGGDIETLIPMLEGVANATAFAGKSAREFSGAIFNLNQSYAGGYLSYTDFNSLDRTYNMFSKQLKQAFIDCAKAAGTLDEEGKTAGGTLVTISNFAQTLSEKWADRTVMENAFGYFAEMTEKAYELVNSGVYDTYTEAYDAIADDFDEVQSAAAKSAQEAKTFQEAIDATKDAVSSGFMETFELIFGNYAEAKDIWSDLANSMYEIFAEPGNKRNEILTEALTSKWSQLNTELTNAGIKEDTFREKLIETGKAHGLVTDEEIESLGTLEEIMKSDWISGDIFAESVRNYSPEATVKSVADRLEEAQSLARDIASGKWGSGAERIRRLTEAGYDYATVQEYANTLMKNGVLTEADLAEAQAEATTVTDEQREALEKLASEAENSESSIGSMIASVNKSSGREKLIQGVKNILGGVVTAIDAIKGAFNDAFGTATAGTITRFVDRFVEFSDKIKMSSKTADGLHNILAGILTPINFLLRSLLPAVTPLLMLVAQLVGVIWDGVGWLGAALADLFGRSWAEDTVTWLADLYEYINIATDAVKNFRENMASVINKENISKWITDFWHSVVNLWNNVSGFWGTIKTKFGPAMQVIRDAFDTVILYIKSSAWPVIRSFLSDIFSSLPTWDAIKTKIQEFIDAFPGLSAFIETVKDKAAEFFNNAKSFFVPVLDSIKEKFLAFGSAIKNGLLPAISDFIRTKLPDFFRNVWEKISGFDFNSLFSAFGTSLSNAFKSVKKFFSPVATLLKKGLNAVGKVAQSFITKITNLPTPLELLRSGLQALLEPIANLITAFGEFLSGIDFAGMFDTIKKVFDKIKDLITKFIDFLKENVEAIDITKIISALAVITIGALVIKVNKALTAVTDMLTSVSKLSTAMESLVGTGKTLLNSISGFFTSISTYTKPVDNTVKLTANNIVKVVMSLVVLIGAVYLLAQIQDTKKLAYAVGAVAILAIVLGTLTKSVAKIGKNLPPSTTLKVQKLGTALLGFAGGVFLLAAAVKLLSAIEFESFSDWGATVGTVIVLMVALTGVAIAVSRFGGKFGISALSVLAMAGSVWLLSAAMTLLSRNLETNGPQAMDLLAQLITMIMALGITAGVAKIGGGVAIAAMVASLFLLLKVLKQLETFSLDGVKANLDNIMPLVNVLLAVFTFLSVAAKYMGKGGKAVIQISVGCALLIGCIALLAKVFEYISGMNQRKLAAAKDAMLTVSAVVLALVLFMGLAMKLGDGNKGWARIGVALLFAVGAIYLLSVVFRVMTNFVEEHSDTSVLFKAGIIVLALGVLIDGLMLAAGGAAKLGGAKGFVYMLSVIAIITAVVVAFYALAPLTDKLDDISGALLKVMIGIAVVIRAMGAAVKLATGKDGKANIKGILTIIAMLIPFVAIAAVIWMLSTQLQNVPWQTLLSALGGIAAIMVAMGFAARLAQNALLGGVALVVASLALVAVATTLILIADLPVDEMLSNALTMVAVLMLVAFISSALGSAAAASLVGAGVVAAICGALLLLAGAFVVFGYGLTIIQGLNFEALATGIASMAGPLLKLGVAGIVLLIGAGGLAVAAVALLALAGVFALVAASAYTVASGLLYLKGAWDFLKTGSTETWDLAVQMDAEASAVRDSADDLTEQINTATEEVNTSMENQNAAIVENTETGTDEIVAATEERTEEITAAAEEQAETVSAENESIIQKIKARMSELGLSWSDIIGLDTSSVAGILGMDVSELKNIDLSSYTQQAAWNSSLDGSSMLGNVDTSGITSSFTNAFSGLSESAGTYGETAAQNFGAKFRAKMDSSRSDILTAGEKVAATACKGFESTDVSSSGTYFVQGLIAGIGENMEALTTAVTQLAQSALDCVNITWQVNSPSKETMWSAKHFVNGMVVGIKANEKYAIYAVESMAENTLDTLNAALDADDVDTAIQPVLDMSDIMAQMDMLGENGEWQPVIHPTLDMSGVNPGLSNLHAIQSYRSIGSSKADSVAATDAAADSAVTFNQYNYSPKALSRFEIYRQTQNQISFIGKVKAR